MSTILIVSKTRMKNGVCVGGIDESTGELIRLHNARGGNLTHDAPYEIGDRWEINVERAWNVRTIPHIEDKQTVPIRKINNVGIKGIESFIRSHHMGNRLIQGSLRDTFEGCLLFFRNKNFINRNKIPSFSTQFWITDKDLVYCNLLKPHYYSYGDIKIKFVGFQNPITIIPAGTLIRLSLANWWNGDGSGEDRCYLQLSGWYL